MFKSAIFTFVLSITLLSCSESAQKERSSDFIVEEVKLSDFTATRSSEDKGLQELKDTAHYYVNMCIKDPAVGSPVIEESFEVSTQVTDNKESNQSYEATTDLNGCLKVYIPIVFDALTCEKYLAGTITLVGKNSYKGQVEIPMYFNPTKITAMAIHDARFSNPEQHNQLDCKKTSLSVAGAKVDGKSLDQI